MVIQLRMLRWCQQSVVSLKLHEFLFFFFFSFVFDLDFFSMLISCLVDRKVSVLGRLSYCHTESTSLILFLFSLTIDNRTFSRLELSKPEQAIEVAHVIFFDLDFLARKMEYFEGAHEYFMGILKILRFSLVCFWLLCCLEESCISFSSWGLGNVMMFLSLLCEEYRLCFKNDHTRATVKDTKIIWLLFSCD